MNYSVGDGIVVTALTSGVVGYLFMQSRERSRRLEIVHAERVAAMEKGIPLPELPLEQMTLKQPPDPRASLMIGIVLAAFGIGAMISMAMVESFRAAWPMPMPVAFMGLGLVLFYYLTADGREESAARRAN